MDFSNPRGFCVEESLRIWLPNVTLEMFLFLLCQYNYYKSAINLLNWVINHFRKGWIKPWMNWYLFTKTRYSIKHSNEKSPLGSTSREILIASEVARSWLAGEIARIIQFGCKGDKSHKQNMCHCQFSCFQGLKGKLRMRKTIMIIIIIIYNCSSNRGKNTNYSSSTNNTNNFHRS